MRLLIIAFLFAATPSVHAQDFNFEFVTTSFCLKMIEGDTLTQLHLPVRVEKEYASLRITSLNTMGVLMESPLEFLGMSADGATLNYTYNFGRGRLTIKPMMQVVTVFHMQGDVIAKYGSSIFEQ